MGGGYILKPKLLAAGVHEDLYSLTVVSSLLFASALMAEPLMMGPAIIEILLGVIASGLGVPKTKTLSLLAMIGSVFLIYMAGLEVDASLLRKIFLGALGVGLASFTPPALTVMLNLHMMGYH